MEMARIWNEGDEIDNWAIDLNPETGEMESNGGVEHLVHYDGRYYLIDTTWDDIPHDIVEIKPETLEDGDFLKELIINHRRE